MAISDIDRERVTLATQQADAAQHELAQALAARDDAIRAALRDGAGISELAALAGVSRVTIYAIRDRA